MHLIRGNHEAADINALFGFRLECLERLGDEDGIWWAGGGGAASCGEGLVGWHPVGRGWWDCTRVVGRHLVGRGWWDGNCMRQRVSVWLGSQGSQEAGAVQVGGKGRPRRQVAHLPRATHPLPPSARVWKRINALFNWLPLAALIEGKILCMHGGIGRCINQVRRATPARSTARRLI